MKKLLTLTSLLAILAFTGCGATTTSNDSKAISNSVMTPASYEIVAEDKYPASQRAYEESASSVTVYHSDVAQDVENFKKVYKELNGSEYKKSFDGTMIVARAGTKANNGYKIRVENIEDEGRYTKVYLVVVKTKGCMVSQTMTSPYTIAFMPNHKEVKFFIEERVVECK